MIKALFFVLLFPSLALAGDCGGDYDRRDSDSLVKTMRRADREAREDRRDQQIDAILQNQRDSRPMTDGEALAMYYHYKRKAELEKQGAASLEKSRALQSNPK